MISPPHDLQTILYLHMSLLSCLADDAQLSSSISHDGVLSVRNMAYTEFR